MIACIGPYKLVGPEEHRKVESKLAVQTYSKSEPLTLSAASTDSRGCCAGLPKIRKVARVNRLNLHGQVMNVIAP